MASIEDNIQNQIFANTNVEKTYLDKLLTRQEVEKVKELVKKERLTRSELLELLYMCLSAESKLVNLSAWDRYVLLKFFVWIREFTKIAELMYDYKELLAEKEKLYKEGKGGFIVDAKTKQILDNNERLIEHNAKFLIDLYLNIARTSLSIGGSAFFEILKNKYEINYPNLANQGQQLENKTGILAKMGLK